MNAAEAFKQLATLPGASPSRAEENGFIDGRLLAGIEFVHARPAPERSTRAAWKRRRGNGATPLVLFTDDPDAAGQVLLLGPLTADEPLRSVSAAAFAQLVAQIADLSELKAVRTFAREIATLDSGGLTGVVVHGIGTEHQLRTRLPEQRAEWEGLSNAIEGFAGKHWKELFTHLGYELVRRPERGYVARADGKKLLVIHPTRDADDFHRLTEQGTVREGALIEDCQAENVTCGILAADDRLRLYLTSDDAGALNRYLQLDIGRLADSDRPLLGLLGPEFVGGGGFERLLSDARDYGAVLRKRLDRSLRQEVLPVLGRELGRAAEAAGQDLGDDSVRERIEGACLTFVFRALFLLYAESAGYLPMGHEAYRARSLTRLCERAAEEGEEAGERATTLWDDLKSVVHAMRSGKSSWGVPAYNGELFAPDGLIGASLLEEYSITDSALAPALAALGRDSEASDARGLDYSGLEIGHLGHIYEGLLSLRLSVAERDLTYVPKDDRYRPTPGDEEPDVREGELTWLTHEGGRKGGGVYYTPARLVRHLIRQSVRPAFEEHLRKVEDLIEDDPDAAADLLFEFHVVDPACGSAHFLVQVADELADQVARLLGSTPMPKVRRELEALRGTVGKTYDNEVEDAALLKRLMIKRCVFGVDISPMGVEIAKLSLWLAGFVPGLSLAYLDRNVICGNSLVGVVDPNEVKGGFGNGETMNLFGDALSERLKAASKTANELQQIPDRTPEEIVRSREKNEEYEKQVAGANRLMDIWTSSFLGHPDAKDRVLEAGEEILKGDDRLEDETYVKAAREQKALHWPTAFAETFTRKDPGFDVVVGNPPWEEVTVEELAFYARYQPGLRALPAGPRSEALAQLKAERPELADELESEGKRAAEMRTYLASSAPGAVSAGDPDLYKYFTYRYKGLLRSGGRIGVVLPRLAFLAHGMKGFRQWLREQAPIKRLDFALNKKKWIFDIHPQYTVALVSAQSGSPEESFSVAGPATSAAEFDRQVEKPAMRVSGKALGPGLEVPLAPGQAEYDLLGKLSGTPFPLGGGAWTCFPVGELHETNDKSFWRDATEGWALWKGGSFDQYDPHGADERKIPITDKLWAKVTKARGNPGAGSLGAVGVPLEARREAAARTVARARVAFRDVTNRTNSRTVIACLVPPETLLLNSAPYLVFLEPGPYSESACLALMNSVPFDWQARRYVESHLNFFILELLRVPKLSLNQVEAVGRRAARLSAVDDRFADFADACGVEIGPLEPAERLKLRAEIDALVAQAWNLTEADLRLMFEDFPETEDGISAEYRAAILSAFAELG